MVFGIRFAIATVQVQAPSIGSGVSPGAVPKHVDVFTSLEQNHVILIHT